MNPLNLTHTLAIVLALGAAGCAGRSAPSARGALTAAHESSQGIDRLWDAPPAGRAGVAGALRPSDGDASRADLWNPPSTGSGRDARSEQGPDGGLYLSDASSGIAF